MNFMLARVQVVQQALGIPGTARPRNGHQNSQNSAHTAAEERAQYAEMGGRGQASLLEQAKTCMIFAFRRYRGVVQAKKVALVPQRLESMARLPTIEPC